MSLGQQDSKVRLLQTAASANGNGTPADGEGYTGAVQIEVAESNGGTCTLALQGSFDGSNWLACGYQQVDNIAVPARAVANISVAANSRHVYQVLDPYPRYQAVMSAVATTPSVTVKAYLVPA